MFLSTRISAALETQVLCDLTSHILTASAQLPFLLYSVSLKYALNLRTIFNPTRVISGFNCNEINTMCQCQEKQSGIYKSKLISRLNDHSVTVYLFVQSFRLITSSRIGVSCRKNCYYKLRLSLEI
jgi:hypothetical protein